MVKTFFPLASSWLTDRGLVRKNNEDVAAMDDNCFVLADGMGGHNAGEVAAQIAVERFLEKAKRLTTGSREEMEAFCKEAILDANASVYTAGLAHPEWKGMGTTLTALLFVQKIVFVTHVGDSRAYRMRGDGDFKQLTVDHTVMSRLKGVEASLLKHVLTRAVGTQKSVKPQVQSFPVHPKDCYLLCSDGLTNHVSDDEILKIMSGKGDLQSKTESFVKKAKARGGSDNITVVLIEVEE